MDASLHLLCNHAYQHTVCSSLTHLHTPQAALLTAQGIYAPSKNCLDELYNYHTASMDMGQLHLEQIDDINQAWSVWGLYNTTLESVVEVRCLLCAVVLGYIAIDCLPEHFAFVWRCMCTQLHV